MTAIVAHRCALCNEAIDPRPDHLLDQRIAAHHAVCPARPVAVGDYVRWERRRNPEMWIEGELVAIGPQRKSVYIDAKTDCGRWPVPLRGRTRCDGPHYQDSTTIRRIPRPAEAQAIAVDDYVEWRPDGYQSRAIGMVLAKSQTAAVIWIREVSKTWTAYEARPIEGHTRSVPLSDLRRLPQPPATPATCAPGCHCDAHAPPPAPALVDGITPAECSARWDAGRAAVEDSTSPALPMTPAQIACAKERYHAYESVGWSRLLDAKVAASREAERNRVTYCEVEPWE